MSYQIPILSVKLVRDSSQRSEMKFVNHPKVAADAIRQYLDGADREVFVVLLLDRNNKMIGIHTVSVGTLHETHAEPREIFKVAILANASGIISGHNHPSEEIAPSPEDRKNTRDIAAAGKLMGIPLMDSVIVSTDPAKFYSFKEQSPYDLG